MRSWLWLALPAFLSFEAEALAGASCTDACTTNAGPSCFSMNQGCLIPPGQATGICAPCSSNDHCAPSGMCFGGSCINVLCGFDAGPSDGPVSDGPDNDGGPDDGGGPGEDGGDTGPGDLGAGSDAGPDTGVDGGLPPADTGVPIDATITAPTPVRPRPGELREKEEGCDCSAIEHRAASPWASIGLALLLFSRRRR
jgi:MYXO-CTERM domain-containing protein